MLIEKNQNNTEVYIFIPSNKSPINFSFILLPSLKSFRIFSCDYKHFS